jgi:hypothetical protein
MRGVKMSFWNLTNPAKPKGIKDPDATISYPINISDWLAGESATYFSHEIIVTGGLVEVSSTHIDGVIDVVLSGGELYTTATFTLRITATRGSVTIIDDRTFYLKIVER